MFGENVFHLCATRQNEEVETGDEHQNSDIHCPVKMTAGVSFQESMPASVLSPCTDMVTKILSSESSLARVSIVVVETSVSSKPAMKPSLL